MNDIFNLCVNFLNWLANVTGTSHVMCEVMRSHTDKARSNMLVHAWTQMSGPNVMRSDAGWSHVTHGLRFSVRTMHRWTYESMFVYIFARFRIDT